MQSIASTIFEKAHPGAGVVILPDRIRHVVDHKTQSLDRLLGDAIRDEAEMIAEARVR